MKIIHNMMIIALIFSVNTSYIHSTPHNHRITVTNKILEKYTSYEKGQSVCIRSVQLKFDTTFKKTQNLFYDLYVMHILLLLGLHLSRINLFVSDAPFLYTLKISENRKLMSSGGRERVHWKQMG